MSNEQEKKPTTTPTTKFASMQKQRETVEELQTIGGGKGNMPQSTLTQKRQDAKTSEHTPDEMFRQTVYMPKSLARRLKSHAAIIDEDISGIITRLVETYLDDVERK